MTASSDNTTMTSERKRKRGPVDVDSPRNAKQIKKPEPVTPNSKIENHADATPKLSRSQLKKQTQVAVLKQEEVEEKSNGAEVSESPKTEIATIATSVQDQQAILKLRREKKAEKAARKERAAAVKLRWKLSEPAGGRILNIDPVFAGNEE